MVHGFRFSLGGVSVISDLHQKMSDCIVCNIVGLIQTSENVCIPDVSANSVLLLLYVAILRLRRLDMSW